jgi:hypothetical protein
VALIALDIELLKSQNLDHNYYKEYSSLLFKGVIFIQKPKDENLPKMGQKSTPSEGSGAEQYILNYGL